MYILYEEIPKKQTDTQKRRNDPIIYDVTPVSRCTSRLEANAWINQDSEKRSWSECD